MVTFILFYWRQTIREHKSASLVAPCHTETCTSFSCSFPWEPIYLCAYSHVLPNSNEGLLHTLLCVCFHRTKYLGDVYISTHVATSLFYWLHNIPLCGHTTNYLMDPYSSLFAIKNNAPVAIDNSWAGAAGCPPCLIFPFPHTRESYKVCISQLPLQLGVAMWLTSGHRM